MTRRRQLDLEPMDDRIRIERPVADMSLRGAGKGKWVEVEEVWAGIEDALPSRGERLASGINAAARPARVRIRYRGDVTPDMRFVLVGEGGDADRVMQIVSGPAELGRRKGEEFMVEDYTSPGNPA